MMLAKPGMGVDEGVMVVSNEMARTLALVRAREGGRTTEAQRIS
jgi:methylaspartate ammonia-lyase